MQRVIKTFDKQKFDFNDLTKFLSNSNWLSRISGNWLNEYILQSSFVITDVHKDKIFNNIIQKIVNENNLFGKSINVHLFVGFTQGASSVIHKDTYSVYLYGLYGETMYIINEQKHIVGQGDFLKINKGEIHQAIGLSPRIVLSLGFYNGI